MAAQFHSWNLLIYIGQLEVRIDAIDCTNVSWEGVYGVTVPEHPQGRMGLPKILNHNLHPIQWCELSILGDINANMKHYA